MGLLDTIDDPQMRLGLGLLAAASPRFDGAGTGQRLMEAVGSLDNWRQQQQKQKLIDLQSKAAQQQISEGDLKIAQMLQQQKLLQALPSLYTGASPALAPLAGDPSTGILPSAGRPAQPGKFDVMKAVSLGMSPEQIKAYADLPNAGRSEVARTAEVEGAGGQKMLRSFDKYGNMVGEDVAGYTAPQSVNLGDKTVFVKPKAGISMQMGQSPDSKASNAVAWANNAISRDRLNWEKSQPSFQWNDSLQTYVDPKTMKTAMPSGVSPAGPKLTEDQAKAMGWLAQATNAYQNMVQAKTDLPGANNPGVNDILAKFPAGGETLATALRSGPRQRYLQAASSLSEALLRAATGAGVNKDEAIQKIKEIVPQPFESEEVIKQKEASIPIYLESLKVRSGPGAKNLGNIMGQGGASGSFGTPSGFRILSVE